MISSLSICLLTLCCASKSTPYERLAPQTSVWSQSIDTRRFDTTRPAESREDLGVFPVGNGHCFTYLGIGVPQNTLFMMTGPRYQTNGNHNPLGGFGELSMTLREAGATVEADRHPRRASGSIHGHEYVRRRNDGQWEDA